MNRNAMASLATLTLLMGAPALAQEAAQSPLSGSATTDSEVRLAGVRARARATSAKEGKEADDQLGKGAEAFNAEAGAKGDATVAARIATDFQETTDAVLSERSKFGAGWGELLIAHTLVANSKTGLTIDQVFQLRGEGMGWGQIVHGMDLRLGTVTRAVTAGARGTAGPTKAERKTPPGGSASAGDPGASAAVRSTAGAAHAKAGAGPERSLPRGRGGR
jgi:hypothetical protein